MSDLVDVPTDAGGMPAHLWLPESGRGPGIVLFQEIFGVSAYVQRRAADLAEHGYVVLAPEIFWRLGRTTPIEGDGALEEGVGLASRLDWEAAVGDGVAAVHALADRDDVVGHVGVLGFCFGGGLGYAVAAATSVAALVSYYGSALPQLHDQVSVTVPSLHHFGLDDSFIDTPTVRRIEESVTRQPATTVHTYPGADHAFDNPDMPWFHEDASQQAWERTVAFLDEHVRG